MKLYKVIYADPPWTFKTWSDKGKGKSAENHYACMTKQDLRNLKIPADEDCILFLWVTAPCLIEGIELCKAWGFDYKTIGFTWVKQNKKADTLFWGMGYWTRSNVELCLIATKGKPKRIAKNVHQVVISKIGRHSEKPHEVYDRIESLMGDVTKLELFARTKREGWDSIGLELDGKDIRDVLGENLNECDTSRRLS